MHAMYHLTRREQDGIRCQISVTVLFVIRKFNRTMNARIMKLYIDLICVIIVEMPYDTVSVPFHIPVIVIVQRCTTDEQRFLEVLFAIRIVVDSKMNENSIRLVYD